MFNFIRGSGRQSGRQSGSISLEQQQQTQKMQLSPQQQIQKELNQQSFTISKRYERASSTYTNLKDKISQQGKKDIEKTFKTFLLSRSTDFILDALKDSNIFSEAFVNDVLVEKARRLIENTTFTPTTQLHQLPKHASWDDIQKIIDVLVGRGNIRQAQRITKIDSKFEPYLLYLIGVRLLHKKEFEQARKIVQKIIQNQDIPFIALLKKSLQEKLPPQPPKTSILADIKNKLSKSSKSSTKPTTLPRPTTLTKSPFFRQRQRRSSFVYQVDPRDPWKH